ncbi:lipopolysaccharide 1,6-galactosyltransferase [Brenneria tiliae]|uniref:lipopolysaccharide 1,6-galactosyltransferase n=1 Tax=Brenneria tiliae TaxID=2914984 RepID=UPI002014B72C|nr:lipopolysaccharide 1,6-galactosyltransferase [Brenneria tiliae]MCL2899301.1 lipopolysaccharide 1,6-galactosyltransferase [Brenneria tiliae]MCL2903679.1 lipopolysaccharide 1,6-galactosyltransferase [Brenneria tiliae]
MKVLFVGEAVSGFGGIETVIQKVTGFLSDDTETKNDYMLYFLCRDDRMDKGWLAGKNAVYAYSTIKISFVRRLQYIYALRRYIEKNTPEIVIAFDAPSCRIASQAIQRSQKTIPLISWVHYSLDHKKHAGRVLAADHHLAISSGIKQQLINRGVPAERISVIFNPVIPQTTVIPRPASSDNAIFIYVGRLKFEGQKRLKDMLDALSGLTGNWECHFIGDGSDAAVCKDYAQKQGIGERVYWHGWQSDPWDYIQKNIKCVSAFVMSSAFEGLPMTLLEAMSYGIYCISSDCPSGPGDIIRNGVNGQLYPPGSTASLRDILQAIINREPMPTAEQIKSSIRHFYSDTYYRAMKKIINAVIHRQIIR